MFTATHLFYSSIRERVGGNAHHQVPEYWPLQESGHDGGDFVFVRQAKASP